MADIQTSKRPASGASSQPPSAKRLTPAMQQYAQQKRQVGDAILFFRMGDFYETFYEDAELCSRVLGIALTSRSKDKSDKPIPLAGVPHHALDNYLTKLVRAGHRVAIAEQMEDAKLAKGVVRREVVRIVTPGTLVDEALLDERSDNVLAAAWSDGQVVGIAAIELASGRFVAFDPGDSDALDELVRLRPAEVLLSEDVPAGSALGRLGEELVNLCGCGITRRPAHEFAAYNAEQALCDQFGVTTLAGFGFAGVDASLQAAGAIVGYLKETQKSSLAHVIRIGRHHSEQFVQLDANTWRSLEIDRTLREGRREGSLLAVIDRTVHPMGSRRLRRWIVAPLRDAQAIRARQEVVGYFAERDGVRRNVRIALRSMADVERIAARVALGRATPRDLAALRGTLLGLPQARQHLGDVAPPLLAELADSLTGLDEIAELLEQAIRPEAPMALRDGGIIRDGYDAELDRLHSLGRDGQAWLARYQKKQVEATGIGTLKVGFNRVFGYYIEISHVHKQAVPPDYVRKQTIKNAERYITDELKHFETEALSAEEKARDVEVALFEHIRNRVAQDIEGLMRVAGAISQIDALSGLAELAVVQRYVKPQLVDDPGVSIQGGRHPVLEQTLSDGFVPNDCDLRSVDARLLMITGPNMAGKSTYIRQIALLTLLAQTGSFVPADAMTLGPVDRIFARVGASDEIARGQSTFMVEMTEAANILNNATPRSLVVLDELGRGTSTFDGLSLAWAITEHLANTVGCLTLMATHYHELTELARLLEGVKNFNVAVREVADADGQESIVFLHRIVEGGTDRSYGVHVAKLAGVPQMVIERSREVLDELEKGFQRETTTTPLSGRKTRREQQLQLFANPADEVAKLLESLDVDQLTPLEGLSRLKQLQDRLRG